VSVAAEAQLENVEVVVVELVVVEAAARVAKVQISNKISSKVVVALPLLRPVSRGTECRSGS
jgi:hypothetical protein